MKAGFEDLANFIWMKPAMDQRKAFFGFSPTVVQERGGAFLLILLSVILVLGCSAKPRPSPVSAPAPSPAPLPQPAVALPETPQVPQAPTWSYDPRGIEIRYRANSDLNFYGEESHTLVLVFYQLTEPNVFTQRAKDETGLRKLLQAAPFDPSAVSVERMIVQPGEERTVFFPRAENAKWMGIVAGYYVLVPDRVSRLFPIPVVGGREGPRPAPLFLNLLLGPYSFQKVGG